MRPTPGQDGQDDEGRIGGMGTLIADADTHQPSSLFRGRHILLPDEPDTGRTCHGANITSSIGATTAIS